MGYQELIETLEKQVESECQEIIASARRRADAIIQAARQEVERINQQMVEETERQQGGVSDKEKGKKAARIRRVSAMMLKVKHDLLTETLEEAKKSLPKLRQRRDYPEVLRRLIQEAVADFADCRTLVVNQEDVEQAKKIAADLGLQVEIEPTREFCGGVVARSQDGRRMVWNSLESRLERLIPVVSTEVAKILYG